MALDKKHIDVVDYFINTVGMDTTEYDKVHDYVSVPTVLTFFIFLLKKTF